MERALKFLAITFIMLFCNQLYARGGDCVYSLAKELNAYCSFITAPDDTKRYLEVVYSPQMAITSCVDNTTLPFSFSKDMIGKNNLVSIGTHTVNFYQCNTVDCANKKSAGVSTFTVKDDKTVTPNKFNITLDATLGENCVLGKLHPNDIAFIIPKTDCKKTPYCATLQLPNKTNKFIKIVSDQDSAFTYCVSNMHAIALSNHVSAGTHTYTFYQCDSLICDNQKLISKETLTVSPGGKFDRDKTTLNFDATFGKDCALSGQ